MSTNHNTLAVNTDTLLADLHEKLTAAEQLREWSFNTLRYQAGDEKRYISRNRFEWTLTHEQVHAFRLGPNAAGYQVREREEAVAAYEEARVVVAQLRDEMAELNRVWVENGCWSRFFMVPGGHIHSSMACSTCRATTLFVWLPQLSGLTEADAVTEYGTVLCSKCFPSAPVEWTTDKTKKGATA